MRRSKVQLPKGDGFTVSHSTRSSDCSSTQLPEPGASNVNSPSGFNETSSKGGVGRAAKVSFNGLALAYPAALSTAMAYSRPACTSNCRPPSAVMSDEAMWLRFVTLVPW